MRKSFLLSVLTVAFLSFFWVLVPVGCANIAPPTGGPRDTIAPRLLKINPPDSTLNFRAKEIVLNFDEFIDIKDAANNIIFTPTFNTPPKISANLRTIKIEFQEPLDTATTYVLSFGNAIVDVNESNALKNFNYIFSTGKALDSLEIQGKVVLAETGGIDSTLLVVLHRNLEDSAVRNARPQYVVKLNQAGEFNFRYLPSDTFAVYALSGNRQYNSSSQLFAFANVPVIAGLSDSVVLYAYRETTPPATGQGTGTARTSTSDKRLRLITPDPGQDLERDYVLSFQSRVTNFDSTKIQLTSDSSFNPVAYTSLWDSSANELQIRSVWKENTRYNLVLEKDFASDVEGRQLLKTDTIYFTTKKLSDYGGITVQIKDLDSSQNPVLQFVRNNQLVLSASLKTGTFSKTLFEPGEYSLRILYDTNDNGKWDPGKFFGEKKQPELVLPLPQTITVKPAWDNKFDISL